jgi:hypothetical protein
VSLQWIKSSFSEEDGNNCIEVAATADHGIRFRESDEPAQIVSTDRARLRALLVGVKAGAFTTAMPPSAAT